MPTNIRRFFTPEDLSQRFCRAVIRCCLTETNQREYPFYTQATICNMPPQTFINIRDNNQRVPLPEYSLGKVGCRFRFGAWDFAVFGKNMVLGMSFVFRDTVSKPFFISERGFDTTTQTLLASLGKTRNFSKKFWDYIAQWNESSRPISFLENF